MLNQLIIRLPMHQFQLVQLRPMLLHIVEQLDQLHLKQPHIVIKPHLKLRQLIELVTQLHLRWLRLHLLLLKLFKLHPMRILLLFKLHQ